MAASKKTNPGLGKGTAATSEERSALGLGAGPVSSREMANVINRRNRGTTQSQLDEAQKKAYETTLKLQQNAGLGGSGNGYGNLMTALSNMYGQAKGQINSSTNNLVDFLNQQKNPYANLQAQTVQATPQLQELLQSQGVSTTPLQQLATVTQAQNAGQTTAYNNLINSLNGMWDAGQMQQQQNVQTLQDSNLQALTGNTMGYGANILGKKNPNQQALIQLINALSGGK